MIDYTTGMIARSEHELMKQSLTPVADFDGCDQKYPPRQRLAQIGKLVQSIGKAASFLTKRPNAEQDKGPECTMEHYHA